MKHCPHCNIDYTGCLDRCALCGTPMSGLPSENPFPTLPIQRTNHRVRRILGGITAVILFSFVVLCMMLRLSWAVGLAGSIAITLNSLIIRIHAHEKPLEAGYHSFACELTRQLIHAGL